MLIVAKFRNIADNQLVRNFTKLFAGSAAAKIIAFANMPVISRLVSPEQFGQFSIFTSVMLLVTPLLAMRYIDAVPIPKSGRLSVQVSILAAVLILFNASLLFFVSCVWVDSITEFYSFVDITFLFLLYCAVLFLAISELLSLWAVRMRNYGVIARAQVFQSLAGALVKVFLSYLAYPLSLLFGQLSQNFAGLVAFLKSRDSILKKYKLIFSFRLMRGAFIRFSQYPKFRLPSQLMLAFTQALPVLAVGKIYGQAEAGQLGLAFSVVTVPVMMVVENVRKLYYGEAVRLGAGRASELLALTLSILMKMVLVALPICLMMYFLSETIFVYVFGEDWLLAGKLASIYSLYVFFLFVTGAFLDLLNVLDRQKIFLMVNAMRLVFVSMSFLFVAKDASLLFAMTTFVSLVSVLNFMLLAYLITSLLWLRKNQLLLM